MSLMTSNLFLGLLQDTSKDLLVLIALLSNRQKGGLQTAVLALNDNITTDANDFSFASLVVVLEVLIMGLKNQIIDQHLLWSFVSHKIIEHTSLCGEGINEETFLPITSTSL